MPAAFAKYLLLPPDIRVARQISRSRMNEAVNNCRFRILLQAKKTRPVMPFAWTGAPGKPGTGNPVSRDSGGMTKKFFLKNTQG